jgi:hypothetical protein
MERYEFAPLSDPQERALRTITDPARYGDAIAHYANPCIVIYGVPVWVMPNGMCRVGEPDASMLSPEHAIATIIQIREEVK